MKKHQIAATVGVIALAANLLLPSLAFGQQTANETIGCPYNAGNPPPAVTLDHIPNQTAGSVTLTPLTAGSGGNAVDTSIGSATSIPGDNLLVVTDHQSGGANGCTTEGGAVTATATDFETSGAGSIIDTTPSTGSPFYLVTTGNIDADSAYSTLFPSPNLDGTDGTVIYNKAADSVNNPGDNHDVTAPQQVTDVTPVLNNNGDVTTYDLGNYQNALTPTTPIDVLKYCSSKNSSFGSGVALALTNVPSNQAAGDYSATVTYTWSPENCGNVVTKLTQPLTSSATTMNWDPANVSVMTQIKNNSLPAVFAIGGEYVEVTAIDDVAYTATIVRGFLDSTASSYNAGTSVYAVGQFFQSAIAPATVNATTTTLTTTNNSVYNVGDTLILHGTDSGSATTATEHVLVTAVNALNGTDITVQRAADYTSAVDFTSNSTVEIDVIDLNTTHFRIG